jgi:hypothetical protein
MLLLFSEQNDPAGQTNSTSHTMLMAVLMFSSLPALALNQ